MIIGVPKEIKNNENRIALTPSGASVLVKTITKYIFKKTEALVADLPMSNTPKLAQKFYPP